MGVVLDRVRRGDADLSGVDRQLAPLLQAALSPNAEDRPHADEVVKALDRYAAGSPVTLAIPFGSTSPATQHLGSSATQVIDQRPFGGREPDSSQAGKPDPHAGVSDPPGLQGPDRPAPPESEPGRPDPRIGRPTRVGTLLALVALVLGVTAAWPVVALGLVIAWSLGARFADRSVTSLVTRRHEHGRRRSDVPLAVVASPWHLLISAAMTVLALLLPAVVAIGATFFAALGVAAVTSNDPQPDRSLPLVVGGIIGLLMAWWGPGGASLRRGSRSLVRALAPGEGTADLVVAAFVLIAAGLGAWAWHRGGQPDWWPWTLGQFPAISDLLQ
jgi:hypothetical protein